MRHNNGQFVIHLETHRTWLKRRSPFINLILRRLSIIPSACTPHHSLSFHRMTHSTSSRVFPPRGAPRIAVPQLLNTQPRHSDIAPIHVRQGLFSLFLKSTAHISSLLVHWYCAATLQIVRFSLFHWRAKMRDS